MKLILPLLVSACLLLVACGSAEDPAPPPPVGVGVYEIRPVDLNRQWRVSARTEAVEAVRVQARVNAEVTAVLFERGARVRAGDVLFRLEDEPLRDQMRQAEAQVKARRSALELAERNLARGLEVADRGFLSAADIDKLRDAASQAQSALTAAEAALAQASLNLDYTLVRAPIDGRVGDTVATVGNVVGPASGPLVSLLATDPIVARFQLTDREFRELIRQRNRGLAADTFEISLLMEEDEPYAWPGELDFVDIAVDETTGTAQITARFPNPDDGLVPGLFATVEIETREQQPALLVPKQAVRRNQLGQFVLVVQPDQTVSERQITLERELRVASVVETGLEPGELVVVEGLQKVRAGGAVKTASYDWDSDTGLLAPIERAEP
ncbi:MAG: efflux RND transporter periplasmic adaptor subunit [Wenzhouxiangella sp.]